ncbi:MAG TPA: hypothetical protein VK770_06755 [Candidatus Acidoferrum sp.]|nr:hypothetical protein [Candidatus Acidoferrum sp.]
MNFMSPPARTSVQLPATLAIGFTGHRKLPDEARCRQAIRRVLLEWRAKTPGVIYGVASAAAGADLLFAETCLELNLPIRIFLPVPKEKFREDFDELSWERAESVFKKALSVEVTGAGEKLTERYYECGIETVQQSQLLLALWDGEPSQGLGGTADMVHFAKEQERPVIWIHSVTCAVQDFNAGPEILNDPEMRFLNQLPGPAVELAAGFPHDLACAWFVKMDENASRVAPQFRRMAAIPIFCTAAAAVLSGKTAYTGSSVIWLWMGTALGIMAASLPTVMRLSRRQVAWTRMRTAAEICRSCLALWRTPALYEVVGPEVVPDLAGMLTSLNFLKMSDRPVRENNLEEFKRLYRSERVQHQIAYFSRHAEHAAAWARRYRIVTWASIILAAGLDFWLLLNAHGLDHSISARLKPELALSVALFFQIATVAGSLVVVNDYVRRRDRYRELHRMLVQWDKQLDLSETWHIVLRIATTVEKALLAELIEWRSHIRNQKLPQK